MSASTTKQAGGFGPLCNAAELVASPAPHEGNAERRHQRTGTMFALIVHYANKVTVWNAYATLDEAVCMADKFRLEAWVIVSSTSEVVYTNR